MATSLLDALLPARTIFVVGKGGVGKSTTAAAIALAFADRGDAVHLVSVDPAHSLRDVFRDALDANATAVCGAKLTVEAFDADGWARARAAEWRDDLSDIIEHGSWLDSSDVAPFLDLPLPGMDEVAAGLHLLEIAGVDRLVIDTAPTGHTLRLLDLEPVVLSWTAALRAMADRAATIASAMVGADARLTGERVIDDLEADARRFHDDLLGSARFVVVGRDDPVVEAETRRLLDALGARGLRIAAVLTTGGAAAPTAGDALWRGSAAWLDDATGCDGLRAWAAAVGAQPGERSGIDAPGGARIVTHPPADSPARRPGAGDFIGHLSQRLVLVAGKGGVGKTTISAALAVRLAEDRRVLLLGADPAGSIGDVLPDAASIAGLRVRQVDARAVTGALRERYRRDVDALFDRLGPGAGNTMDRRVAESLIDLAPPGIDEVAAVIDLVDAASDDETIVFDSAPTGHFLRLIALPQIALAWTHSLLRTLLKYRAAGALDGVAEGLLRFAKQLKDLQLTLTDPARCGLVLVTLDEPVVLAETERLEDAIVSAHVPIAARVVNGGAWAGARAGAPVIRAPRTSPPVGAAALRDFVDLWEVAA